jgi:DNA end-binding protein Ku
MRFAHEIRPQKDLDLPASGRGWSESEMKLARQLVDTLSDDWNPAEYRDTYSGALRKVIEAKVEGKDTAVSERPAPAKVTDLMEALKRSLEERPRELANAPGRQHIRSRKPARARRHRAA